MAPIHLAMNLSSTALIAWSVCLLLAGSVLATDQNAPVPAPTVAPELTTDTLEYCNTLRARVTNMIQHARVPPPTEAVDLSTQGGLMCDQGQPRSGVQRLRRALILLHQHQAGP